MIECSAFRKEPQVMNLGQQNLLQIIVVIEHSCLMNLVVEAKGREDHTLCPLSFGSLVLG